MKLPFGIDFNQVSSV